MGNSIGCVRPPHEREPSGPPPLSPKKRLRFRRKHKGKKKTALEKADFEHQRSLVADEEEEEEEDENCEEKPSAIETADLDCIRAQTLTRVPDPQSIHSKNYLHSHTLSPGSLSVTQDLVSRLNEASPNPSPAWRGVFCLPGEEDTVSSIIDVSVIPSQTTNVPINTAPTAGCVTPGGGRVCRVKEKVQGVLEKPWILHQQQQKKKKRDANKAEGDKIKCGDIKPGVIHAERERKDVVHIREVDGKLCVVKTVYPSNFGSPVWNGDGENQVDVNKDLYVPPRAVGNIIKVERSEEEATRSKTLPRGLPVLSDHAQETESSLETPDCAQELRLLESGYASDLPLTSPETAGTTPCQTDWGGLTGSSSERLDSMIESPLSMQHRPAAESLPQVCLFFTSCQVWLPTLFSSHLIF